MNRHNTHPLSNVDVPVMPADMAEIYAAAIAQVQNIKPLIVEVETKRYAEFQQYIQGQFKAREAARAERYRLVTAAASVKVAWWRLGSRKRKQAAEAAVAALHYRRPEPLGTFRSRGVGYFVEPLQKCLDVATMASSTLILTAEQVEHMARWADGRALAELIQRLNDELQFQPTN